MPYVTLSAQIKKLHNPQRSDFFIKQLRTSVREGEVVAAILPTRFELPKKFRKRGTATTYTRTVRDMIIDATPIFETWFEQVNADLAPARSNGKIRVNAATIEAGLVDFKTLAAETRRKLAASYSKGQALGKGQAAAKRARTGARTPTNAPANTPTTQTKMPPKTTPRSAAAKRT